MNLGDLHKNVDKVIKKSQSELDKIMNNVPDEYRGQIAQLSKDIKDSIEALRKGDNTKINDLNRKYADYNNK